MLSKVPESILVPVARLPSCSLDLLTCAPARGKPFPLSVCIFLFVHGLFHVLPPVRPLLWSLVVFSLPRIHLAHIFDVLLRWWLLGVCAGLWGWGCVWGLGCCGPPGAPTTGLPSRRRASCPGSPLGAAPISALCTPPCLGPCYCQSSGHSCPSGQVQTHIRGGHRGLASGLCVDGCVGGEGRETPERPSLIGQCSVPPGLRLWTGLSRRTGNNSRQLHRQG